MVAKVTAREAAYLKSLYYDLQKTGSLRGPNSLYKLVKEENRHIISLEKIHAWLHSEPVYSLWKPARKNYPRNSINALYPGHIMQFDLMAFTTEKEKHSEGAYEYCLIAIDSFR